MWFFCLWLQPSSRKHWWSSLIYRLTVFQKESRELCSLLFYSRFFLDLSALPQPRHIFFSSVLALPNKGAATCHGHVLAATSHHRQEPWPHSASPLPSVLTIPSTILPNYLIFFPSLLSRAVPFIESVMSLFPCISLMPGIILLFLMMIKRFNTCICMLWTHTYGIYCKSGHN